MMEEESAKFGLHDSWAKTKIQNLDASPGASDVLENHQIVSGIRKFTYLGCKFSSNTNSGLWLIDRSEWRISHYGFIAACTMMIKITASHPVLNT